MSIILCGVSLSAAAGCRRRRLKKATTNVFNCLPISSTLFFRDLRLLRGESAPEFPGAQKNLHLCRFGAFENPQCRLGALASVFGSHYAFGGPASPEDITFSAPSGYSIGSSKVSPSSRAPQRLQGRRRPYGDECSTSSAAFQASAVAQRPLPPSRPF